MTSRSLARGAAALAALLAPAAAGAAPLDAVLRLAEAPPSVALLAAGLGLLAVSVRRESDD